MKKKIFGIKLNTILTVIACLAAAVVFWLLVKYTESTEPVAYIKSISDIRGYL